MKAEQCLRRTLDRVRMGRALIALPIVILASLAAGCGRDTPAGPSADASTAGTTQRVSAEQSADQNQPSNCSFSRGVTECVTTAQRQENSSHAEISGCLYGPTGIPGRRTRTFADVLLVTETTTTHQHGRHGAVYDSSTATRTERLSSSMVSDVCERI